METDTIAAIATGLTDSGIGIVRVSGNQAFSIIGNIFRKKNGKPADLNKSHMVQYGFIFDGDERIDEVLVLLMKGPHSYTAEDTVEIDCHGGILVMKKILETVIKNGARTAEPGEFTKRAFLNGRIDLSQAEAVIDVINAKNEFALKSSVSQMNGNLSKKIKEIRGDILYEIAHIESALDDPEHISLDGYREELLQKILSIIEKMKKMEDSFHSGRILSEGIRTVIVGKPNAGKSSLMNVLLGEERAIVTEVAGTTRDILEEQIRLGDVSLQIVDTAGIRNTDDLVEKIGVSRAKNAAEEADLIIYVVDGSVPLDENDNEIIAMIQDKNTVVLLNKSDLSMVISEKDLAELTGKRVISVSAKEETGMDEFKQEIKTMFYNGTIDFNDQVLITNVRHKEALSESLKSLNLVVNSIYQGLPEDFYSIDLMDAYRKLGVIIGEAVEDDVVNEIFSKFCTGK